MSDSSLVKDIAGELPLKEAYEDLVHPTASAIGKTLALPFRAVNVLLTPFAKWVQDGEKKLTEVSELVAQRVQNTPEDQLTSPEPYVAIPALQAIAYSMDSSKLRDLYAGLLAKAITSATKDDVHPAYVEIIKQLSPFDASVLKMLHENISNAFAICDLRWQVCQFSAHNDPSPFRGISTGRDVFTNLVSLEPGKLAPKEATTSVENLARLGLIQIIPHVPLIPDTLYSCFEDCTPLNECREWAKTTTDFDSERHLREIVLVKGSANVTNLGNAFIRVCIAD